MIRLKFGCEIEFLLPKQNIESWETSAQLVCDAINAEGRVACHIGENDRGQQRYEEWAVVSDCSLRSFCGEGSCHNMELVSPIMSNITSTSWEHQIDAVWSVLQLQFDPVVNISCGTHIHVSPETGWTLDQTKQLSRGAIYYFHQLNALIPLDRVMNQYCRGNRITSGLIRSSVRNIFDLIHQAEDIAKLTALMCHGPMRKYAWNLGCLTEGTGIEFRLPPGSKSPEDTRAWIELTLSFVAACLTRTEWNPTDCPTMREFKRFIFKGAETANIGDTSRLLGLFATTSWDKIEIGAGIWGYCDALVAKWDIENVEEEIVVLGP